jgi:hypothetical protein
MNKDQVALTDAEMDKLLASHALAPDLLRQDAFDSFIEDRRRRLSRLVESAMGKAVVLVPEDGDYEERND